MDGGRLSFSAASVHPSYLGLVRGRPSAWSIGSTTQTAPNDRSTRRFPGYARRGPRQTFHLCPALPAARRTVSSHVRRFRRVGAKPPTHRLVLLQERSARLLDLSASPFAANAASRSSVAVPGRLQLVRTHATIARTRPLFMELLISAATLRLLQAATTLMRPASSSEAFAE
jgi:hypothetical protein